MLTSHAEGHSLRKLLKFYHACQQAPKLVKLEVPAPQYSHACNKVTVMSSLLTSSIDPSSKSSLHDKRHLPSWLLPGLCHAREASWRNEEGAKEAAGDASTMQTILQV